ncbi:hypothetical protein F4774DRAFT_402313 [Daldinia eschscholtzii]|nr:hypothetical protein F4774DRAFT_402313 [Daldinia eschscholtzii]
MAHLCAVLYYSSTLLNQLCYAISRRGTCGGSFRRKGDETRITKTKLINPLVGMYWYGYRRIPNLSPYYLRYLVRYKYLM